MHRLWYHMFLINLFAADSNECERGKSITCLVFDDPEVFVCVRLLIRSGSFLIGVRWVLMIKTSIRIYYLHLLPCVLSKVAIIQY